MENVVPEKSQLKGITNALEATRWNLIEGCYFVVERWMPQGWKLKCVIRVLGAPRILAYLATKWKLRDVKHAFWGIDHSTKMQLKNVICVDCWVPQGLKLNGATSVFGAPIIWQQITGCVFLPHWLLGILGFICYQRSYLRWVKHSKTIFATGLSMWLFLPW